MIWTYSIEADTLPPSVRLVDFLRILARALRRVEKVCAGQVSFVATSARTRLEIGPRPHVTFGFDVPAPGAIADTLRVRAADGRDVHSIAFDPGTKWRTRWYHLAGRQDLYTLAVHELGHLLGLPHSDDPGSVMWPNPTFSQFSELEEAELLFLTRPKPQPEGMAA